MGNSKVKGKVKVKVSGNINGNIKVNINNTRAIEGLRNHEAKRDPDSCTPSPRSGTR